MVWSDRCYPRSFPGVTNVAISRSVFDRYWVRSALGGMEVIVVDGLSDDGTREILENLSREHAELRVVDNPRRATLRWMRAFVKHVAGLSPSWAHIVIIPPIIYGFAPLCRRIIRRRDASVGLLSASARASSARRLPQPCPILLG